MSPGASAFGHSGGSDASSASSGTTNSQVVAVPEGAESPSLSWPDGIYEVRPWPRRTAVLLADKPYDTVVDALRRIGFATVQVSPSVDLSQLDDVDPFAFVLVQPEVFG
jgi:hypothetical protein